jgi:hypothetical protein
MRRTFLALAVAALMAVMAASAAAAAPAPDAGAPIGACPPSFPNVDVPRADPSLPDAHFGLVPVDYALDLIRLDLDSPGVESIDANNDGLTCLKLNPSGTRVVFVDNHFPLQQ